MEPLPTQHYHAPIEGIETCVFGVFEAIGIFPSITMPRLRGLKLEVPPRELVAGDFTQHYHAPIEGIETKIAEKIPTARPRPSITMPRLRGLKL